MDYNDLMKKAKEASMNSYSPYSKFAVGACLLTESGNIYTGCNFENSSFGLTICAERNAVGSAINNGERKFTAIAIYSPNAEYCYPCGACRQVLSEFKSESGLLVITDGKEGLKIISLDSLLPESFVL